MKKILLLFFFAMSLEFQAQTKLCYDVYYFKNPRHQIKKYKNILVITNAHPETYKTLKKIALKYKYKITFSKNIFPPVKDYTDNEIKRGIKQNNIDAILYYTIVGTDIYESTITYGTYTLPKNGYAGTTTSYKPTTFYTNIEAALVEPGTRDEKEFNCSGGAKGNSYDVTCRVFGKMLKKFQTIGVAYPLDDFDPSLFIESVKTLNYSEISRQQEIGNINIKNKKYDDALENFNTVISLDPDNEYAYFNRAIARSAIADTIGAALDYDKAIELNPDFSMAYNNRGWGKFLTKDYISAIEDFNKAIEIDPTNSVAFDSRQETKFALSDFAGCMEDCDAAISINPKSANSYLFKGKIYIKNGEKEKACQNWSKAGQYGAMEAYELIKQNCN